MSTAVVTRGPSADPELIERGLLALAECNGNGAKAERLLAEDNVSIDHSTLYRWKRRFAEQYERVRAEVVPKVRLRASEDHMALSARLMETEGKLLTRLESTIEELPPKEVSTALRNVSTSAAIHVDKAQVLSDQPTEIRRLDAGEVLRKLGSRGMRIEATERTLVAESTE